MTQCFAGQRSKVYVDTAYDERKIGGKSYIEEGLLLDFK